MQVVNFPRTEKQHKKRLAMLKRAYKERWIQDFVKIRRGTDPKTALKKCMKILWYYLLNNSKDFKTTETITIQFSKRDER